MFLSLSMKWGDQIHRIGEDSHFCCCCCCSWLPFHNTWNFVTHSWMDSGRSLETWSKREFGINNQLGQEDDWFTDWLNIYVWKNKYMRIKRLEIETTRKGGSLKMIWRWYLNLGFLFLNNFESLSSFGSQFPYFWKWGEFIISKSASSYKTLMTQSFKFGAKTP